MSEKDANSDLPKIPALDASDVQAVRSFLPGKVLGRTAALLSLVLLVLGFAGAVDLGLRRFLNVKLEPTWLYDTLLFGLPILIVAAQLVVEGYAARNRRKAQALAIRTDTVPSGYFRIGPYLDTTTDQAKFNRADHAHERVLAWITKSVASPLYLTGDSGSGKSSLLNAFVLPQLRTTGWRLIEARAGQDPLAALRNAVPEVSTANPNPTEAQDLRALLEAATRRGKERLLIVLDQFEEFIILGTTEAKEAFAAFVESLRERPLPRVLLLVVLRSDYQVALEDLGLPPLRQGENWHQVGRFTIRASSRFMEASGLQLQSGALDRLLGSAADMDDSPGLVRPITLNVVGHVLAEGRTSASSLDAGRLVAQYVQHAIEQPAIRNLARPVLETLVTEQGTKHPQQAERDIAEATGLRTAEVRAVMNALSVASLARSLNASGGPAVWELSHDFVARTVLRYLSRRRRFSLRVFVPYIPSALLVTVFMIAGGAVAWKTLHDQSDRALQPLTHMKIAFTMRLSSDALGTHNFLDHSAPRIISAVTAKCVQHFSRRSCSAGDGLFAFYSDRTPNTTHDGSTQATSSPKLITMYPFSSLWPPGLMFKTEDYNVSVQIYTKHREVFEFAGSDLYLVCDSKMLSPLQLFYYPNTHDVILGTSPAETKILRDTGEITSVPDLRDTTVLVHVTTRDYGLATLDCMYLEPKPGRRLYLKLQELVAERSSGNSHTYQFALPSDLSLLAEPCRYKP